MISLKQNIQCRTHVKDSNLGWEPTDLPLSYLASPDVNAPTLKYYITESWLNILMWSNSAYQWKSYLSDDVMYFSFIIFLGPVDNGFKYVNLRRAEWTSFNNINYCRLQIQRDYYEPWPVSKGYRWVTMPKQPVFIWRLWHANLLTNPLSLRLVGAVGARIHVRSLNSQRWPTVNWIWTRVLKVSSPELYHWAILSSQTIATNKGTMAKKYTITEYSSEQLCDQMPCFPQF